MSGETRAAPGFRPDVQGLRAIAVSLVVIYHLYPSRLPGGYVGVDVFFVISGFLITGHLARTLQRTGRVGFVEFYGRRARRLMPAAVLVLAVTWFASRAILPTTQLPAAAEQIRASALYFQNWVLAHDAVSYLHSADAPSPVQHFWSLSVEEQFYVGWPLLVLVAAGVARALARGPRADDAVAARRAALSRHVLFAFALAVVAVSLAYSVHETRTNPAAAYFVTTTRVWELALGGAVALLAEPVARRVARVGVLGWAGLVLIVVSAFVIDGTSAFPGYIAVLPVGGAALLIACGSDRARLGPARFMSARPMVFLGDISYSLYLWHWPLIVLWQARTGNGIGIVDGPLIVVASVALAWLTKVLVEDRVRLAPFFARHRWRSLATVLAAALPVALAWNFIAHEPAPYRFTAQAVRPTSAHPGAALLAGTAKPAAAAHVGFVPPLAAAKNDLTAYPDGPGGCQTVQEASHLTPCTYGDTVHPVQTVALVGDSVAGEWFTALDAIAVQRHWKLLLNLHSTCPWTVTMMVDPVTGGDYTNCNTWGKNLLASLLAAKPDVVITSARPAIGTPEHPKPGVAAFEQIGAGTAVYWKKLIAAGIPVVPIIESPEMGRNIPDCLSAHGATVRSCSTPTSEAVLTHTPLEVATSRTGAGTHPVDLNSLICGPTVCSPVVGNVLLYRDSHHLTKTYTVTLEPFLEQKLLATGVFR